MIALVVAIAGIMLPAIAGKLKKYIEITKVKYKNIFFTEKTGNKMQTEQKDPIEILTLYVESGLLGDSKDVCANVGARGDEIHGMLIVLVPN